MGIVLRPVDDNDGNITLRAADVLPTTSTDDIFIVSDGYCTVHLMCGFVESDLSSDNNSIKIWHVVEGDDPNTDRTRLCEWQYIAGDPVGQIYSLPNGTEQKLAAAYGKMPSRATIGQGGLLIAPGTIFIECDGTSGTGTVSWDIRWSPLDPPGNGIIEAAP